MPSKPLCFTGYGPGGAAGAAAKAGYPTGTGKESLTPLPAKGPVTTQAPELRSGQGLSRNQASPPCIQTPVFPWKKALGGAALSVLSLCCLQSSPTITSTTYTHQFSQGWNRRPQEIQGHCFQSLYFLSHRGWPPGCSSGSS